MGELSAQSYHGSGELIKRDVYVYKCQVVTVTISIKVKYATIPNHIS